MTDVVQLIGEVKSSVEGMKVANAAFDAQIKAINETAARGETVGKDAIAMAEKTAAELTGFANRIQDVEQKLVDGLKAGKEIDKSLGAQVVAAQGFKDFVSGATNRSRFEVQANTLTGQNSDSPRTSDNTLVPEQRGALVEGARRRLNVRNALVNVTTNSNAIVYPKENTWTNNAAETRENALKPESVLTYTNATATVQTIAHIIKITKQLLDDAPAIAGIINSKMGYGVDFKVDSQLLNGTGGDQLDGLLKSGNFTAFTPSSGHTALDSINRAKYLVESADYSATAIMLNPATWGAIERTKTTQGEYLIGNPNGVSITPFLWGLPVVLSNAFPANKFHVSAVELLATVYNRMGTIVEMFEQDGDNVQYNRVTIRAEARLALAVERPAVAYYGNLTL